MANTRQNASATTPVGASTTSPPPSVPTPSTVATEEPTPEKEAPVPEEHTPLASGPGMRNERDAQNKTTALAEKHFEQHKTAWRSNRTAFIMY